jgi:drug/metabolite transporter (DMT)-like permease
VTAGVASSERWRGTLAVIGSACAFGSISPLTIIATDEGMALPAIQLWRYATTSTLLLLLLRWPSRRAGIRPAQGSVGRPWFHPVTLLLAGGGQALVATLALSALRWLPAATSGFLFYTFPAWVTILAALRGTEPIDRTRLVALVLSLGGVGLMVGTPQAGSLHPVGVGVILCGALTYALYIPLLARLRAQHDPVQVAAAIALGGTLIFTVWTALVRAPLAPSTQAVGAAVLQGLLSTGAFLGFLAGLSLLGTVRTAITSTAEPFWTMLLGVIMLGQPVGIGTLLGGLGIMGAVLLLQRTPAPVRHSTPHD